MKSLMVSALFLILGMSAPLHALTGYVRIPNPTVGIAAIPVNLTIASDWQSASLTARGQTLSSLSVVTKTVADMTQIAIAFEQPKDAKDQGPFVMTGSYQGGQNFLFKGKIVRFTATNPVTDWSAALNNLLAGVSTGTMKQAEFEFSPKTVPVRPSAFAYPYPPSDYVKGVPVDRGFAPSGDPSNPCPIGPCWTDAGVGRHLEYYVGPIQNPGHAIPAARFDTGPGSRAEQLDAQLVGIQRARMIQETYGRYSYPMWGFFWAMW